MKDIPNSVRRLGHVNPIDKGRYSRLVKHLQYNIVTETGGIRIFSVTKKVDSDDVSREIVEQNEVSSCGYITVRFSNGEFGYIRECDGKIIPYRYDIAFDFSEYGFAMVGRGNFVTWINTNFEYLTNSGVFVPDDENRTFTFSQQTFIEIDSFLEETFLSRVWYYIADLDHVVSYLSTDGELRRFYENGDTSNPSVMRIPVKEFRKFSLKGFPDDMKFTSFNEDGYILLNDRLLLSSGAYYNLDSLIASAFKSGQIEELLNLQNSKSHVLKSIGEQNKS